MSTDKKTDAWMPLWIGAYLADTLHLDTAEHGAYLLLLMAYWRNQGPLPDDDKRLAATCKASPAEWKRLRPVLAEFFVVGDGVWMQKRAQSELSGAGGRQTNASAKAKAAAEARWGKGRANDDAQAMQKDLLEQCSEQCLEHEKNMLEECPTPSPLKDKRNTPLPPKGSERESPEFVEAWEAYPNRAGGSSRAASLKAWNARIRNGVKPAEMLAGVKRYAAHLAKEGKIGTPYVKQAETFFGPNEHWKTEYEPAAASANDWWRVAGFKDQFEAENAGCTVRVAHLWRNGRRVEIA